MNNEEKQIEYILVNFMSIDVGINKEYIIRDRIKRYIRSVSNNERTEILDKFGITGQYNVIYKFDGTDIKKLNEKQRRQKAIEIILFQL